MKQAVSCRDWLRLIRKGWLNLLVVGVLVGLGSLQTMAQSITTLPLAVTAVCAGAQLDVAGRITGEVNNLRVIISADGITYSPVTSVPLTTTASGEVTYRATIPATAQAGNAYQVRLISADSAIVGTLSTSQLRIKAKPEPPKVPALLTTCERANGSNSAFIGISVTVTSPMTVSKLYNPDGSIPYNDSSTPNYFVVVKGGAGTQYFYATQLLDGCESEKTEIKLVVSPRAPSPVPVNIWSTNGEIWGEITYRQGDKAVSIREYGLQPLPDNVQVAYVRESGDLPIIGLPDYPNAYNSLGDISPGIPNTSKPGRAVVKFRTYLNGCVNSIFQTEHLVITVLPTTLVENPVLADAIVVYPVPATTEVNVRIQGFLPPLTGWVELLDRRGNILYQAQIWQGEFAVGLQNYPQGDYWLRIHVGDQQVTKPIIKQ
ncbi:T9SS type A sorting domain-containing protein [Spirosoma panaciterrae]|uniref:T9SS type A sorting domain-containing protein n=1 Tax=Spirosoma panaciterrae TaxID=496058 RepID=UPI00035C2E65|nr:T9SS type A sorting domain-containing protein [Spirosoma panaciterrae]